MRAFDNIHTYSNTEELSRFLDEKLKDYPPILERTFKNLDSDLLSPPSDKFRIMQWNILARALCPTEPYFGKATPLYVYDWEKYRLWRTLQEMNRYSCDIICIEEADAYEELKPYMESLGYTSVFCPKYRSPCLKFEGNVGPDGSAVFYRKSIFQVNSFSCEKIITNNKINNQIMLIIDLMHKPSGKLLTLVCLHLKADPDFANKRKAQAKAVLEALALHCSISKNKRRQPIIVTGDLNGTPSEEFYKVFTQDKIIQNLEDAYTVAVGKKEPTIVFFDNNHKFSLELDYMFYNRNNLALCSYLELPKNDELIEQEGLPNAKYSSDHLSLVCDFEFI